MKTGAWQTALAQLADELGDDDLTELYDLEVPRVDLVSKGANGMPFLIAKSAAGAGVFDAGTVHQLLKSGSIGAQPGAGSKGAHTMRSSPTPPPRRSARTVPTRKTAKTPPELMIVYNAAGVAVGTVDPAKLNPVANPGGSLQDARNQNAQRVLSQSAVADQGDQADVGLANEVTEDVRKALAGARYLPVADTQRRPLAKSAGAPSVDRRFDMLMASIAPPHRERVRSAVVVGGVKLAGRGVPNHIEIAKRIALNIVGM